MCKYLLKREDIFTPPHMTHIAACADLGPDVCEAQFAHDRPKSNCPTLNLKHIAVCLFWFRSCYRWQTFSGRLLKIVSTINLLGLNLKQFNQTKKDRTCSLEVSDHKNLSVPIPWLGFCTTSFFIWRRRTPAWLTNEFPSLSNEHPDEGSLPALSHPPVQPGAPLSYCAPTKGQSGPSNKDINLILWPPANYRQHNSPGWAFLHPFHSNPLTRYVDFHSES